MLKRLKFYKDNMSTAAQWSVMSSKWSMPDSDKFSLRFRRLFIAFVGYIFTVSRYKQQLYAKKMTKLFLLLLCPGRDLLLNLFGTVLSSSVHR
jgi:hypothetical protein